MDNGLGLALALSLPAFCVLVVGVGLPNIRRLMMRKPKSESTPKVADLLNITNAIPVSKNLQQKTYKLTTSPRLDMTKVGTYGLMDYSVNGRICKSYVQIATKLKPKKNENKNDY